MVVCVGAVPCEFSRGAEIAKYEGVSATEKLSSGVLHFDIQKILKQLKAHFMEVNI